MSSTPRLPSRFPATPGTERRQRAPQETPSSTKSVSTSGRSTTRSPTLPLAPENLPPSAGSEPVIPLTILDAPQQRLYAAAFYFLLFAWKIYDWLHIVEDGDGSWAQFFKWMFVDFIFLFGLPELRIPWLELSQFAVTTAFLAHMVFNYMLMLNIPLPWQAWFIGFAKVLWDSELSVSEHSVKVSNILNNHSLIMGKQIINILPEGSAILNPEHTPFCIGPDKEHSIAVLPIFFNATVPAEIEFIRVDIDSLKEETIKISTREVNKIAKQIRDQHAEPDTAGFQWDYRVKKPGVYRLGKVLDEYKLEVQRSNGDTYVVPCPSARIESADKSPRCIRDLSDLSLEVTGTPPLKIKYSRTRNGKNHSFHFQSLQPEGHSSPLVGSGNALVLPADFDLAWVQPAKVKVSLNESMDSAGEWVYSVDEVHDAFGNQKTYNDGTDELDKKGKPASDQLSHMFDVKERPKASMKGCDLRNPLKVAKGKAAQLPIKYRLEGPSDTAHKITWEFSPIDSLTNSGDHGNMVSLGEFTAKDSTELPKVTEPGLYTLKTVSSGTCAGQVEEPSSCLLLNPLEPHLSLRSEEIPDKCAGNSIGLRVDLDLVGTPPFVVRYEVHSGGRPVKEMRRIHGLREQLELIPKTDGHHKYIFTSIDDAVYTGLPLNGADKVLEQVVKPAASARILGSRGISACLDSQVEIDVELGGDAPWTVEWEVVHDGRRKTEKVTGVEDPMFKIKTAPLVKGGEYVLALSSVQDKRGCKTFLQDQTKISVRRQRPRGGFGLVEGKRNVMTVADTPSRVPLRLSGEGPWKVAYRNIDEGDAVTTKTVQGANDFILLDTRGKYEIVSVNDKQCPGDVDTTASQFVVDWHARPELSLVETESFKPGAPGAFEKQDVCEGDVDGFEINLSGAPPFHVEYEIKHKPLHGSNAISRRQLDAVQSKSAISLDTSKAGDYAYTFSGLADTLYDSDRKAKPLTLKQRVNPRPSAVFAKPGQTFKYCMEEQAQEDKIPITLTGTAPFHVEIEIKHHGGAAPQTYSIPSINSKSWGIQVPRQHLSLGNQQIRIRRVRDARGCQQKYDAGTGPAINIQLFDAPSIYPLESRQDFCVGERIAYTLSGTPPFDITYDFNGKWNAKSQTTSFRRIAEKPGDFTITSVADKASECRAAVNIPKTIHPMPSVQISRGKQSRVDIHEGNEVDILFEFWGSPPFEFTYTRSSNARKGQKSVVLETRHDVSHENSKIVKASQEGTYEVVAIKDKYCSFSTQQVEVKEKR